MNKNVLIKNKFYELINNKTFMTCCLLTVVYLISGYWKWLEIGVSLIALIFFITQPIQSSFCVYAYLHSFTLSNISYQSFLTVTTICFCSVLVVKYLKGIKVNSYPVYKKILKIIGLFTVVTTLISMPNKLYYSAIMYLTYLPMFYLIFAMRKEFNIGQAMKYMIAGVFATSILAFIFQFLPGFQYDVMTYNRFIGFTNHPNSLSIRALFCLSYYMYCFLNNKLKLWQFSIIYLVSAVVILSTISKMGIALLCLISLVTLVLYLKQDFKSRIKYVGIFMAILLIIALVCHNYILTVVKRFLVGEGMFEAGINSLTTGRDDIWSDYLTQCFKNPLTFLFGNGMLTQEVYIHAQAQVRAPHSLYIFLMYRFGVVGICVLAYLVYLFIKELNKEKPKFIAYLPMITFLIISLVSNTFKSYNFTYIIFAAQILFENCKNNFEVSSANKIQNTKKEK